MGVPRRRSTRAGCARWTRRNGGPTKCLKSDAVRCGSEPVVNVDSNPRGKRPSWAGCSTGARITPHVLTRNTQGIMQGRCRRLGRQRLGLGAFPSLRAVGDTRTVNRSGLRDPLAAHSVTASRTSRLLCASRADGTGEPRSVRDGRSGRSIPPPDGAPGATRQAHESPRCARGSVRASRRCTCRCRAYMR